MLTIRNLNRLFCFHYVNVVYSVFYSQCSKFEHSIGIRAHLLKRSTNVLGLPNAFSISYLAIRINRSLFIQFFDNINKLFQGWTNWNSRKFESIFPKNLSSVWFSKFHATKGNSRIFTKKKKYEIEEMVWNALAASVAHRTRQFNVGFFFFRQK